MPYVIDEADFEQLKSALATHGFHLAGRRIPDEPADAAASGSPAAPADAWRPVAAAADVPWLLVLDAAADAAASGAKASSASPAAPASDAPASSGWPDAPTDAPNPADAPASSASPDAPASSASPAALTETLTATEAPFYSAYHLDALTDALASLAVPTDAPKVGLLGLPGRASVAGNGR